MHIHVILDISIYTRCPRNGKNVKFSHSDSSQIKANKYTTNYSIKKERLYFGVRKREKEAWVGWGTCELRGKN